MYACTGVYKDNYKQHIGLHASLALMLVRGNFDTLQESTLKICSEQSKYGARNIYISVSTALRHVG